MLRGLDENITCISTFYWRLLRRKENPSRVRALVLITVVGALSSCIMVREGNLHGPGKWPLDPVSTKKSISLTITGNVSSGGSQEPSSPQLLQLYEGQSQRAYMESGLFSDVSLLRKAEDLSAEVSIVEEGNKSLAFLSGFISGFTFGVIPGYAKADVIMVTTFRDRTGKELGTIRQSESLSFWIQIFLVAVMPFREEPKAIARDTYYDLNRATLDQARAQGIL